MKFAPSRRADRGTFYRISPVTGFGSPIGPPHLSPPCCHQHQELKGQPGGPHRCRFPHRPDHRSHLPMGQCLYVHCWGQAHRQLWDKLRHAGRAVEVFAVAWDQQHLDRTQRLLQTWTRGAPPLLSWPLPGLGMIDSFRLWGSSRCRRIHAPLKKGGGSSRWRMLLTTTTLLSQRASPRCCGGVVTWKSALDAGWNEFPASAATKRSDAAPRVSPPRPARRRAAPEGRWWRERPPLFDRWCGTGEG